MILTLCSCGEKNSESETEVSSSVTEVTPQQKLLEDVSGTYDELFTVICDEKYDSVWNEKCEKIVGEEQAEISAEMLKSACTGKIYGEEAVNIYSESPESSQFDCYFINGVDKFIFDGNHISGIDESGNSVFSHDYEYVKDLSIAGAMDGYLYKTTDNDAGEFKYFLMLPDTPATTYHIEFRYGSDEESLTKYDEGKYAYWLAAGITDNYNQQMIDNVITLFVEENLSES